LASVETVSAVQTGLGEHPAVRGWRQLKSRSGDPRGIEILKGKSPNGTGRIRRLVCRLVGVGPAGTSVIGKRAWRSSAMVENTIYAQLLPDLPVASLNYYGMVEEANGEFCWLFLEDAGERAYSKTLDRHRALSTQWLSLMHTSAAQLATATYLPDKGPDHYLKRLQFARGAILKNLAGLQHHADISTPLQAIVSRCDELESRWDQVEAFCEAMPQTLVHGDFVAKNLRMRSDQAELTVLPFDWGEAGWGTPAVDITLVDVSDYWSHVRSHWSWLGASAIRRLALVGRIFRGLDAIWWELGALKTHKLGQRASALPVYASWMADAIRAAGLR
jgi:hypothetical protein